MQRQHIYFSHLQFTDESPGGPCLQAMNEVLATCIAESTLLTFSYSIMQNYICLKFLSLCKRTLVMAQLLWDLVPVAVQ